MTITQVAGGSNMVKRGPVRQPTRTRPNTTIAPATTNKMCTEGKSGQKAKSVCSSILARLDRVETKFRASPRPFWATQIHAIDSTVLISARPRHVIQVVDANLALVAVPSFVRPDDVAPPAAVDVGARVVLPCFSIHDARV